MMFKVRPKENNKLRLSTEFHMRIFAVEQDAHGYPKFLTYHRDNGWVWLSAKHFEPIE